jgi:hypothetical protein
MQIFKDVVALVLAGHGLIHLMGFLAYFPITELPMMPYKTAVLGGRLELGKGGMRLYAVLWLLSMIGFIAAAIGMLASWSYWAPLLLVSAIISLVACTLDWKNAYMGVVLDVVVILAMLVIFGLQAQPGAFQPYPGAAGAVATAPVPENLPAPVERYLRLIYGDEIPVYTSAVMSGRGSLRFMGVSMPARLRFTHDVGQGYRHYIETTIFGLPILKVNERYLDGVGRMELPFGVVENDPGVNSAANQGLWAEMLMYPASVVNDPRARWEAVDDSTAKLFVPYQDGEQEFTLRFDPQTGLLTQYETLRYRDEKLGKLRWWGDVIYGMDAAGKPVVREFEVTWEDEGTPWLKAKIEQMVFNPDVSEYIRQKGE